LFSFFIAPICFWAPTFCLSTRFSLPIDHKTNEIRMNHTEKGKSVMKLYSNNKRIVPRCCVLACHLLVLYFPLCFFTITRCWGYTK
jgi:hypothetical protein